MKVIIGIVIVVIVLAGAYFYITRKPVATPAPSPVPVVQTTGQNAVTLSSGGFSPATLTIKAGTKVTWANQSGAAATVNSDPHPAHSDYLPLNLGSFQNGGSLSLIFDKTGTYGYHNHLNPGQRGTIVVQ